VAGKSGSPSSDKGDSSSAGKSGQQSDEKPQPQPNDSQSSEKSAADRPAGNETPQSQPQDKSNNTKPPDNKTDPQSDTKAESQKAEPQQTGPQKTPPAADQPPSKPEQPAAPPPATAQNSPPPPAPTPPPPLPSPGALFGSLAGLLKLALYAALIGGVAFGAWRSRAELMEIVAGWLAALRAFWRSLFVDPDEIAPTAEEIAFHQQQLGWAFGDFVDPFASGAAGQSSPAELVKYTFAALEAWGREQGHARGPDETPHEFVALLGSKVPGLRADALGLANLYSRAVYSQASLPPAAINNLAQLWRLMQAARAQQPVMPE
jgi:hypothetical protein